MKTLPATMVCLFVMIGSAITYVAHASEWRQGTDSDITFVVRLVFEGMAVMEGNPTSGNWRWKLVDKRGC